MQGFNSKFKDFPDYILGITHEIWEEKQVEKLYQYYAKEIPVRSPSSLVIGNKAVIDATHATLAEFPDRQLLGEDVIWSGSPEEGMLSSHRIFSTATHLGTGSFGKPTGKKLHYRVIADCHAISNQINDEWLVRDDKLEFLQELSDMASAGEHALAWEMRSHGSRGGRSCA